MSDKCENCTGFTKEQIFIGYYLCTVNSTKDVEYIVKPTSTTCGNFEKKGEKDE